MASINIDLVKKLVNDGFFDNPKIIEEIVIRLDQKGFSLKGKQVSLLSRLLAVSCQKDILIREKDSESNWRYKKNEGL